MSQRSIQSFRGSQSHAMGMTKTTLSGPESAIHNLSSYALESPQSITMLAGAENRWFLDKLSNAYLGININLSSYDFISASISQYGVSEYKETKFHLAFAKKLSRSFAGSVYLDYNTIKITGYGQRSSVGFGLGIAGHVNDWIQYGMTFENVESINLSGQTIDRKLLSIGLRYNVSASFNIFTELEKSLSHPLSFKLAIQQNFTDAFALYFGLISEPSGFGFGSSIQVLTHYRLLTSAHYNLILGVTPSLSIIYSR